MGRFSTEVIQAFKRKVCHACEKLGLGNICLSSAKGRINLPYFLGIPYKLVTIFALKSSYTKEMSIFDILFIRSPKVSLKFLQSFISVIHSWRAHLHNRWNGRPLRIMAAILILIWFQVIIKFMSFSLLGNFFFLLIFFFFPIQPGPLRWDFNSFFSLTLTDSYLPCFENVKTPRSTKYPMEIWVPLRAS